MILQTLSKAWEVQPFVWGWLCLTGDHSGIEQYQIPYNINILTQEQALRAIENKKQVEDWVRILLSEGTAD